MKHLFLVNPICKKVKGNPSGVINEIKSLMRGHPGISYDIHITRWHRDALGYCREYILNSNGETVRVHVLGGTGTHFEVVNATVELHNVQLALYPYGNANTFLHYFGLKNASLFSSIGNQVFSDVTAIDAIRCNHNYGISNILIGFEAYVDNKGDKLIEKTRLPIDFCYSIVALPSLFKKNLTQSYKIALDDLNLDGKYITIMVANQPWYGKGMCPGIDAHPNDGVLDVYMSTDLPRFKRLSVMPAYLHGKYKKYPDLLRHYTGRRLEILSDELMWLSVDGETFYGNNIECEIMPDAICFVCPSGVQINKSGKDGF